MENVDVVRKLIGEIKPIGETNTDNERFINLQQMTALVDELLHDILEVAKQKDAVEFSRHRAGRLANSYIQYIQIY